MPFARGTGTWNWIEIIAIAALIEKLGSFLVNVSSATSTPFKDARAESVYSREVFVNLQKSPSKGHGIS